MYAALIEALEAASEPSRELDAALWLACFEPTCARHEVTFQVEHFDNYVSRTGIDCDLGSMWVDQMDPPLRCYTASVDSTIELIELVLPGYLYGVRHTSQWAPHHKWAGRPVWDALIGDPGESDSYEPWCDHDAYDDYDEVDEHMADHCTPALALCTALLRALKATRLAQEQRPKQDSGVK